MRTSPLPTRPIQNPRDNSSPQADLSVDVGPLELSNPVMVASGTFGALFDRILDVHRLGAVVVKTVTLHPRKGNPPPRVAETPSGMLNSIGLENKGLDSFIKNELPHLSKYRCKLIVSISGKNLDEYVTLVRKLNEFSRIDAYELNISCPNVTEGGLDCGAHPEIAEKIVATVRKNTTLPVIAKLTPNVTDVTAIARAAINGGADILSLINTLKGLGVNWRKRSPVLGGITGGLSGPAIKPVALRMVWEVASVFDIPIIGIGGISTANDVLEFMCAGASAIQVGTANFVDCQTSTRIIDDLPGLLAQEKIAHIRDVIRTFSVKYSPKVRESGG